MVLRVARRLTVACLQEGAAEQHEVYPQIAACSLATTVKDQEEEEEEEEEVQLGELPQKEQEAVCWLEHQKGETEEYCRPNSSHGRATSRRPYGGLRKQYQCHNHPRTR